MKNLIHAYYVDPYFIYIFKYVCIILIQINKSLRTVNVGNAVSPPSPEPVVIAAPVAAPLPRALTPPLQFTLAGGGSWGIQASAPVPALVAPHPQVAKPPVISNVLTVVGAEKLAHALQVAYFGIYILKVYRFFT